MLLAVQVLNLSVDVRDVQPAHLPENLTCNDIESFVELIVEEWLDVEDAIGEYDDSDGSGLLKSAQTLDLYYHPVSEIRITASARRKAQDEFGRQLMAGIEVVDELIQPPEA
ncbi:MAG: hypothetical protein NW241_17900 [Bacteroidia bacterium]|nr:hypothetical protein [Bacteroidia bacterium]